jgi:hypothetical protein
MLLDKMPLAEINDALFITRTSLEAVSPGEGLEFQEPGTTTNSLNVARHYNAENSEGRHLKEKKSC